MTVENDFVVPYNPYLLLKYRAHINVEVVASIEAVKYLYKYITKGTDRVMVRFTDGQMHEIRNPNEVEHYQNTRYLSASESLSRIYDYAIVHKYPPVELLDVHLEDEQGVFFTEHTAETVADRGPPRTKLTEYFDLNLRDAAARDILYPDIYRNYTWDKAKRWKPRLRTMHIPTGAVPDYGDKSDKIGRLPVLSLSVHTEERYFLRMLLYNKPGATSFADLRTVDGDEQATFKDACLKIGLLETDRELDWVMEEAALMSFGSALIAVFATMLIFLQPAKALEFWERHRNALCQHLMIRDRLAEPTPAMVNDVLLELRDHLQRHGLHPTDNNYPLPPPDENQRTVTDEREIREETDFDLPTLQLSLDEHLRNMTAEQRRVYDRVVGSVRNNRGLIIALDAPGGSGKSYVLEAILAYVRLQGNVALATATTGIAATLLPNGRTMHSRCKVPINITAESTCSVTRRDSTGKLIIESKLFVCDEVTSAPRYCFEAVDRSFQDLREDRRPFGGMTTVLCGDWRQILPVVRRGSPADILDACLKSSLLWRHVQVEHLRRNMRVELSGAADNQFTDHLLDIGEGRVTIVEELGQYTIRLKDAFVSESIELGDLCNFVYQDLRDNIHDRQWLCSRAVLCPTNKAKDEVNELMLHRFPGEARIYKSADRLMDDTDATQYPTEYLNGISVSGMPHHRLALKVGLPIMLLRNMDPSRGHCNGTRYIINSLHEHVIEATVAVGVNSGTTYFIPRIHTVPSEHLFPFTFQRRQFPICVCFGMTANKAQGQTLSKIGIYLQKNFFSHGQLYVAMSRVGNPTSIKILAPLGRFPNYDGNYADNVVFHDILR